MRLDCTLYTKTLADSIQIFFKRYPSPEDAVAQLSASTGVPAMAVCLYALRNLVPGDKGLLEMSERLTKFYGYTEVKE